MTRFVNNKRLRFSARLSAAAVAALILMYTLEPWTALPQYRVARLAQIQRELRCGIQNATLPKAMIESSNGEVGSTGGSHGLLPTATPIVLPGYMQRNLDDDFAPYESAAFPSSKNASHKARSQDHKQMQTFHSSPANIRSHYHRISKGMHIQIRSNVATVVQSLGNFESRNGNTLAMLNDVLALYRVPDLDVLVSTDDKPRSGRDGRDNDGIPILVMAKRVGETYLTYPDHTFYGWTEARTCPWDVERERIGEASKGWTVGSDDDTSKTAASADTSSDKRGYSARGRRSSKRRKRRHNVAFFRGNPKTDALRQGLVAASDHHLKLDARGVQVGKSRGGMASGFVSLADHSRYKYLLHIPGISYAARLKYLLHAGGVVLWVQRRQPTARDEGSDGGGDGVGDDYREFWYNYLQDDANCLVVPASDGNDAVEGVLAAVRRLESNADTYDSIVRLNAEWREEFDFATVLSYWAALLRRYALAMDRS